MKTLLTQRRKLEFYQKISDFNKSNSIIILSQFEGELPVIDFGDKVYYDTNDIWLRFICLSTSKLNRILSGVLISLFLKNPKKMNNPSLVKILRNNFYPTELNFGFKLSQLGAIPPLDINITEPVSFMSLWTKHQYLCLQRLYSNKNDLIIQRINAEVDMVVESINSKEREYWQQINLTELEIIIQSCISKYAPSLHRLDL